MIKLLFQKARTFTCGALLLIAMACVIVVIVTPSKVVAEQLGSATPAYLEVRSLRSGKVENSITLSRDKLLAAPLTKITTTTPWTEGLQEFEGVPLKGLIRAVSENVLIKLIALNDYTVTLQSSELSDEFPIVAFKMNGKTLRVRDRGPFWIIYPFDKPEYKSEKFFAQSVWQLKAIDIILK
ncbi:hypothetical protein RAZWK3B_08591 [Roseobacter sp. AzwK-3b]|uniref:hypothetical protein n=1 Tax=Roseobacter sp. AzwK-3b TaxID=351016 RepID=UPI00015691E9|nr:hypothetical protein [Roseobacter sp. AzwK-3b]EDM72294.1 hypothetical protein RAZWK3B_08591 [Roseobacter sp. AzwK-3b]